VVDRRLRQRLDMKWAETRSTRAEAGVIRGNFGPLYEWTAAVVASPPSWTDDDLNGAKLLLVALMVVSGRRGADLQQRVHIQSSRNGGRRAQG
jgi:hypothetical protein